MITTICAVAVGTILFFNNASESKIEENNLVDTNESRLTDSVLIVEEHEEVINEYLEKVAAIVPQNLNEKEETISKLKGNTSLNKLTESKVINPALSDTLKKKSKGFAISKRNKEILDTAYRYPNLGYEEIIANNKQKKIMFGKVKKQRKSRGKKLVGVQGEEQWYQPDPAGFLFIPMGEYDSKGEKHSIQAFYMKQTEVTNLEYRTFLFDLLIHSRKKEFLLAKPDQKIWVKEYPNAFNEPMVDMYFSHPAYDGYPAVGMSREGAKMYCEWFTEELSKTIGNLVNNVRLPYYIEWEYAAKGKNGKNKYSSGKGLENEAGCHLANFKPKRPESFRKEGEKFQEYCYICDGAFHTAKANSYNPNDFGLYCMSGNVAEMVKYKNGETGTKGGSWSSIGQELQIVDGKDRFKGQTTPSCNVGFRPVMTYLGRASSEKAGITIAPPGAKKINHNLFFDETEVTNAMWKEYLSWLGKTHGKTSSEYKEALPDTTVWITKDGGLNKPYVKHYFSHAAYLQYPVVGVSYEQAVAFCMWRTDRVKELFDLQKVKNKKEIYPKEFEYRLPTKAEWERVARVGYSEKTLKKIEKKHKGEMKSNLKRKRGDNMGVAGKLNDNADVTAPVNAYWPNKYGVYNTTGNVAEMVSEKGIAKGFSWMHTKEEASYIEKDLTYTKPTNWVGFRCVFEVKDAEK